jgi:hypothetical protein
MAGMMPGMPANMNGFANRPMGIQNPQMFNQMQYQPMGMNGMGSITPPQF